jgi:cytochrome c oxidase subunit 4
MKETSFAVTSAAWVALLGLTATSFALSYAHLGPLGVPVALGIAVIKASVVAFVFMEVAHEPFTVRASLVAGLFFLLLLVFFVVADVVTRAPPPLLPFMPPR